MTQFMNDLVLVIPEFAKARFPSSQEEREKLAHIIVNEKALRFCEVAEMPLKQKQVQNFSKCGPQTTFLASKHLLRPAQCFEFDMPGINDCLVWSSYISINNC